MRVFVFGAIALLAAAASPASAGPVYYLDLVNSSPSSIVSFDVAAAGSERFQSVLTERTMLPGHGASATVAIRKGDAGCRRDLRVGYADGHVATYHDFDVCGSHSYRVAQGQVTQR